MRENKKTNKIMLGADGTEEVELLATILSLGLCHGITSGALQARSACYRFFDPALLRHLKKTGVSPELQDAITMALELEDVELILPEKLHAAAVELEIRLVDILKKISHKEGRPWLLNRK